MPQPSSSFCGFFNTYNDNILLKNVEDKEAVTCWMFFSKSRGILSHLITLKVEHREHFRIACTTIHETPLSRSLSCFKTKPSTL